MIALVGFALLFVGVSQIAGSLGVAAGFLLGALNALLVGATLSLIEQSLGGARSLQLHDIQESLGCYFWEVIGVGFVLWLPVMALDMGTPANPYGQFLSSAALLLLGARESARANAVMVAVKLAASPWASWRACAMPTIPGTFSVPARRARS